MIKKYIIFTFTLILIFVTSLFIIQEGKIGVCLKLGKIKKDINNNIIIYKPGLHFKIPYLEKIKILNFNKQILNCKRKKFLTSNRKYILLDYYIVWNIDNYNLYYLFTKGNKNNAENLIKNKFNNLLKYEIKKLSLKYIITNSKKKIINNIIKNLNNKYFKLNNIIFKKNNNFIKKVGINIFDIKINKIILSNESYNDIYKKIKDKKKNMSDKYKLEGKIISEKLKSSEIYKIKKFLYNIKIKSSIIKGKANLEACKILHSLFEKNIDFYRFIKNLKIYKKIINKEDILILNKNNNLFKYLYK